jgi:hypothetical protein
LVDIAYGDYPTDHPLVKEYLDKVFSENGRIFVRLKAGNHARKLHKSRRNKYFIQTGSESKVGNYQLETCKVFEGDNGETWYLFITVDKRNHKRV